MASAFLSLVYAKQIRAANGDASYAARLFNYAQYQVPYKVATSCKYGIAASPWLQL